MKIIRLNAKDFNVTAVTTAKKVIAELEESGFITGEDTVKDRRFYDCSMTIETETSIILFDGVSEDLSFGQVVSKDLENEA